MANMLNANSFELQDWLKDASAEELQPYVYSYDFSENYDEDNPVHSNWMTIVDYYAAYLSDGIKGARPDYQEARRLLEITTNIGHSLQGSVNLAEMYELKRGVSLNFPKANDLYELVTASAMYYDEETGLSKFAWERLDAIKERTDSFSMRINTLKSLTTNTNLVGGEISSGVVSNDDKLLIETDSGRMQAKVLSITCMNQERASAEEGETILLSIVSDGRIPSLKEGDMVYSINYNFSKSRNAEYSNSSTDINTSEQEYLEEYKCMLADGEIGERERKSLNRLCERLGLSSARAAELEAAATGKPLSKEEQEYLDEYREMLADGGVRDRDRRTLQRLAQRNGISDARTRELERLA